MVEDIVLRFFKVFLVWIQLKALMLKTKHDHSLNSFETNIQKPLNLRKA